MNKRTVYSPGMSVLKEKRQNMVIVAAGNQRTQIFPALTVSIELRRCVQTVDLTWVSLGNSKIRNMCRKHQIHLIRSSINRKGTVKKVCQTVKETVQFTRMFGRNRPKAVVSFGGAECIPVLAAARFRSVPYYLYEQDSVPSLTSRFFGKGARKVFLGFPHAGPKPLHGAAELTGVPLRPVNRPYDEKVYFRGFDRKKKTILIISRQDQASLINPYLLSVVEQWITKGYQIVWQTGKCDYKSIKQRFNNNSGIFIFKNIKDRYPYYAASRLVICRAETSILSEIAYFGLPCIVIPRTTKKDNPLWINAGVVEMQGWGIRLVQDETLPQLLMEAAGNILEDDFRFELMCRKALDHAPLNAASRISRTICEDIFNRN